MFIGNTVMWSMVKMHCIFASCSTIVYPLTFGEIMGMVIYARKIIVASNSFYCALKLDSITIYPMKSSTMPQVGQAKLDELHEDYVSNIMRLHLQRMKELTEMSKKRRELLVPAGETGRPFLHIIQGQPSASLTSCIALNAWIPKAF